MTTYIALLRAVNVGGTGKLPMASLKAMADDLGYADARTYIASGNLLFRSDDGEATVKAALEASLAAFAGKQVGVTIRTAAEMAQVLADTPFPDRAGNRTVAIFLDGPGTLDGVTGRRNEELRLGRREIYVWYGDGMAESKLRIPAAAVGTARNMNTVAKLVALAEALAAANA